MEYYAFWPWEAARKYASSNPTTTTDGQSCTYVHSMKPSPNRATMSFQLPPRPNLAEVRSLSISILTIPPVKSNGWRRDAGALGMDPNPRIYACEYDSCPADNNNAIGPLCPTSRLQ